MSTPRPSVLRLLRRGVTIYLRPFWKEQALLALSVIPAVALRTYQPIALKQLVDKALTHHDGRVLVSTVATLTGLLVLATLSDAGQALLRSSFGSELKSHLRERLFAQLQRMPADYFDRAEPGKISSLFAHDLLTLRDALRGLFINGFRACLQFVITVCLMLALSPRLTIMLLLLLLLGARWQRLALERSEQADVQESEGDAKVVAAVQDNVLMQPTLRAFHLGTAATQTFVKQILKRQGPPRTLGDYDRAFVRKGLQAPTFLKSKVGLVASLQATGLYVVALTGGAALAYRGDLSTGSFTAMLSLLTSLTGAAAGLTSFFGDCVSAGTALDNLEAVFEHHPGPTSGQESLPAVRGAFSFQGVSFRYPGSGPGSGIRDVNFSLPDTGRVALVGRSGCGKSTVLRLLLRLHDPQKGQVALDGYDLKTLRRSSWGSQVAVVLQEPDLANRSVRDNIALARPQASDEEVEAAARAAAVHAEILRLPQGYATRVGERGKLLSVGQRQRIALARALITRPRVLLLDEVTSALDPATEAAVQTTLRACAESTLVVQLTHRLASLEDDEHVVLFDRGSVAQTGRVRALRNEPGPFRELARAQGGFEVSGDGRQAQVSAERLADIPLFAGVEAAVLGELAEWFAPQSFEPGQALCREGEPGERYFLLVRGRARVTARTSRK